MKTILVTSTEPSTGKTAISVALARIAQQAGHDVGYMKPKGTRLESAVGKTRDEDPMLAREMLGIDAAMHELEPVVYSPTFVQEAIRGREDPAALRERISENFETLAEDRDVMIVEGGGRLWTGGIVDLDDTDVAELLDAEVLLVSRYEDGESLDDVLAAADSLGDRLSGVLFNAVDRTAFDGLAEDAMPFLDGRGIHPLGAIERDEQLAGISVADLADGIGAKLLTSDAPTDSLVERFAVGAMGSNAALEKFRRVRNAAVITGGDRSDIQTTALQAPGVECLVLTGGYRPSSAVVGKAEEHGIPLMLVQSDTSTTIDRVEEELRSGRTRSEGAIDRMETLIEDAVDTKALLE
ncbi:phosphotransacetylase family protein [Salinibaculum rarum]|uniref:phosphotransacetylase family protein n=1 Tax=Salinibaculum rarum TaxID=3058903 RepID=UPI00265ECA2D|nr:phosphotransacetylase family protein [Salinibaculum sp. KK48]